jgi:hypothetical protein
MEQIMPRDIGSYVNRIRIRTIPNIHGPLLAYIARVIPVDILLVKRVNNNNMVQLGEYIQIISPIIYGGALIVSILQFSAMKKSMSSQSVQQTYATTTQVLFNNLNSKEYLQMSQESPVVSKYYSLVDSPQQYYVIIQCFDMLEFIFRLYRTKMIDNELWLRWEATAKSMMTIPKFMNVWDKTKASRSYHFRELIDSLASDLQKD